MIPTVDGRLLHFVVTGVYDGIFVMRDVETRTLWNHVTGEAMDGPLRGRKMAVANLLQTSVRQVLALDPTTEVALSSRPISGRRNRPDPGAQLSDKFAGTIDVQAEDTRRPRMELGLGLTVGNHRRFYPLEAIRKRGDAFFDVIDRRPVLIYVDPETFTPAALFARGNTARVEGQEIRLDDGRVIRGGVFLGRDGQPQSFERPLQVFTRWYGFSLTFPGCDVFDP